MYSRLRERVRLLCFSLFCVAPHLFSPLIVAGESPALQLKAGPHLFVDDFLVGSVSNVVCKPMTLVRGELSELPILTSTQHQTFQPFFTVLCDATSGVFRLWYGIPSEDFSTTRTRLAYMESPDGIHWTNQPRVLDVGPIQFGASVIDEGPGFMNPDQRYKLGWYFEKGLQIATSPDGFNWKHLAPNVVIEHNHDINGIFWDSVRQRYCAILSFNATGDLWKGNRRITKQAVSTNLLNWSDPQVILTPDAQDEGETQFYAMDGILTRGDVTLGMVKVLRDDLKADQPPQPADAYGLGYTTVASTRNGKDWIRGRTPFLPRNPRSGSWDHAHAWIDEQVLVGDEVYLYYAGYKSGHKVNRFQERQIGLIKMKRDRYVARESVGVGVLRTPPVALSTKRFFVNADASHGELRVQLLTPDGKSIKGFTAADCQPIQADAVKSVVSWRNQGRPLPKKVIIEFVLRDAVLFGFELE